MSNVHGLRDLEGGPGGQNGQQRVAAVSFAVGYPSGEPAELRCLDSFFPNFSMLTFIFIVSVVQTIMFIICCIVGSKELEPTVPTLIGMGGLYGILVQQGDVWRLITPIFLHNSIWHLMFNLFFQLRMGLPLEASYGTAKLMMIYFISGIGGNLLSVAINPCIVAAGASTSGFGLIGVQMAEVALVWHLIANRDRVLVNLLIFAVMALLLTFAPGSTIDWRGHVGGFITGFCICILLNRSGESKPRWFKGGFILSIAVVVTMFLVCIGVAIFVPVAGRCS